MTSQRAFPNILQVDPDGCGCNECSCGEYIPCDEWELLATAADLAAVLNGDVNNATGKRILDLIFTNYFPSRSATEYQTQLSAALDEKMHLISMDLRPLDILESVSWVQD